MRSFLCSAIFLAYASASFTYDETEMLCLVNKERTQRGLSALGKDARLTAAAQSHSSEQARRRKMTHDGADGSTPGQRIDRQNYNWMAVAENVAYGYDDEVQCMDAWMNSPGHRANILSPKYVEMGSAVAFNGAVPYYTQDFGNAGKPPKNIPNCGGGNGNDVVKRRRGDRQSKEDERRRQQEEDRKRQDDNQRNDNNQDDNQDSDQDNDRRRQEEEDKQKQDDDRKRQDDDRKKQEEEDKKKQEDDDRKKQEDEDKKKKEDEDKKQQNGNNDKHNRRRRRRYTKKPRWFQDQFANKARKPQGQLHKECRMVDEAGFTFPLDYGKAKETTKKGGCGK